MNNKITITESKLNRLIRESINEVLAEYTEGDLDKEMAIWQERSNSEFGKIIKQLDDIMKEMFSEEGEYGWEVSPISNIVTEYSLDGNKKVTAKSIYRVLENYDMLQEPEVNNLVKRMFNLVNTDMSSDNQSL